MLVEILSPQNYQANSFALPPFITACILLALGFMVRSREQGSRASLAFLLMTASGALWLFSSALMYCASSEAVAKFWSYTGQAGVNLIPAAVYNFTASSLQADGKIRRRAWLIWELAALLTIALFFTDGFLAGVRLYAWGYYPLYDWLGTVFLGFFLLVMLLSLQLYRASYRRALAGPGRQRAKGLYSALAVATLAAVDFLPAFGVALYPLGYFPILGFIVLANLTIRRYRLVTITPAFAAKEIIDAMDDALLVFDNSGIVQVSNQAALRLFSRAEAALTGSDIKSLAQLLCPEEAALWQRILAGSLRDYECTLSLPGREPTTLSLSSFAMGERGLEPVAAVCILRDIGQHKLAEQQIRRHGERQAALYELNLAASSTLDLGAVLAVLLDRLAQLVPGNAMTVELLRAGSQELAKIAGRGIDERQWQARQPSIAAAGHPVVRAKDTVLVSDLNLIAGGLDRQYFLSQGFTAYLGLPLIAKDEVIGVVSFYARQPRHYSSDELTFLRALASHAAVAIRNSDLYQQTMRQARELARANEIKEDFLSVMSHELRTPLNVIAGYTKLLQEGMMGEINAEQNKALDKVTHHAGELLFMVNSIMHATKIEAGLVQAEKQRFNLNEFFAALKTLYDYPHGSEIELRWHFPNDLPVIDSDQEKLKHVLQNLINNAIKFTDRGTVTVTARHLAERQAVEISVSDTGIGIGAEELPHIFERFRQADGSRTRTHGGVGLGLHIVKTFTELLGGTVSVTSAPARGSTFTVVIPCNGQRPAQSPTFYDESHP